MYISTYLYVCVNVCGTSQWKHLVLQPNQYQPKKRASVQISPRLSNVLFAFFLRKFRVQGLEVSMKFATPMDLASSYESQHIDKYKYIDSDATLGQSLVQTTSSGRAKSLLELEPNSIPNPARRCIGGLRVYSLVFKGRFLNVV